MTTDPTSLRCAAPLIGVAALAAFLTLSAPVAAQHASATLDELAAAVVRVKTFINPDGRSVATLGPLREGSGVLIDGDGLILTIGYLILEAHSAEIVEGSGRTLQASVVGYDHETGFGLLKVAAPAGLRPIPLGRSAAVKARDPLLVLSSGGPNMAAPVHVVSKREFAGGW